MTREPIEVTRQDRVYCLKASSDYHRELCEECRFYPNCDHMTQDDMTELTIKDLEALDQEPCEDAVSRAEVIKITKEMYLEVANMELDVKTISDCISCTSSKCREVLERKLQSLESVTSQEPRKGHWIVNKWGNISCSECGCNALYDKVYTDNSPSGKVIRIKSTFCPTCGAYMREVKE